MSHKNDFLEVEVKENPNCKVELTVTLSPSFLQKVRKEAVKEVNKEVTVAGFRKGKAPEELLNKSHGAKIEAKLKERMANDAFQEAVKLAKVVVLHGNSNIQYTLKSFEKDHAVLIFQFEVEPSLPTLDFAKCKIKKVKEEKIGQKEVNEALKQLLLFYAKWTPITDRGVQEKDFVIIDLETLEEPKEKVFTGTRFEVTDKAMASWMKKLILDAKPGAVLEGVSEPDSSLSEKEKKDFAPKKVKLTLQKIEQAELPKLEEEFLQKLGVKTEEDLRKNLDEMLKKKAEQKKEQETREQVNTYLLQVPFDLPLSLIESEKKHRYKQFAQNPSNQKHLEQMSKEKKEEMDAHFTKQAENAVRLFYTSRKIVQDAGISVTHKEVEMEAIRTLQSYGPMQIDPKKIPNEVFALALSKLILARAQDHILEQRKKLDDTAKATL